MIYEQISRKNSDGAFDVTFISPNFLGLDRKIMEDFCCMFDLDQTYLETDSFMGSLAELFN